MIFWKNILINIYCYLLEFYFSSDYILFWLVKITNINNLLDLKYKSGGYEQARNGNFTQVNQDYTPNLNPNGTTTINPQFGSKYFYGYGRTFLVNLYINF
jgi:hypothetical protein